MVYIVVPLLVTFYLLLSEDIIYKSWRATYLKLLKYIENVYAK